MDEEEMLLQQALAMSMAAEAEASAGDAAAPVAPAAAAEAAAPAGGAGAADQAFLDPAFVSGLLQGLPGVDMNDPKIQAAMAAVTNTGGGDKKDGDDKKDGGDGKDKDSSS